MAAAAVLVVPALSIRTPLPSAFTALFSHAEATTNVVQATLRELVATAYVLGPIAVLAGLSFYVFERRPRSSGAVPTAPATIWGLLLGTFGILATAGLVMSQTRFSVRLVGMEPLAVVFSVGLTGLQAAIEEGVFRGWLQPVLRARWGPLPGLLVASVLFGVAHAQLENFSPLLFLNYALAGSAFGVLAARTGSIWAPLAAHFSWNFTEAHVLGADPNPGLDPLGSLFDLDFFGAVWWTGGAGALEGSLAATVALAVLMLACAKLGPRARPHSGGV